MGAAGGGRRAGWPTPTSAACWTACPTCWPTRREPGGRSAAGPVGAVLALLLLPLLGAAPAAGTTRPTPRRPPASSPAEPEAPVDVSVSTLAPRAPQPGGRVQLKGTLTNTGSSPVERLRVALRVGDRLRSRSELALADEEGSPTRRVPGSTVTLEDVALPPGGTRPFDVSVPVDDLGLGGDGAYPLEVEVRGRIDGGSTAELVGLAGTFLPWFAEPPTGTTRLAFVWPLVAPPVQAPRRTQDGSVLLDDDARGDALPGRPPRPGTAGSPRRRDRRVRHARRAARRRGGPPHLLPRASRSRSPTRSTPTCSRRRAAWPAATGCGPPAGASSRAPAARRPATSWPPCATARPPATSSPCPTPTPTSSR